ncbi:MAG: glutathione S-transferase family protein [Geitlerinemataceae cyanobacterium]
MHLLQFSTSHYCRKARLALGYKGCDYITENLTPGLHALRVKPLTGLTTLPVLLLERDSPDPDAVTLEAIGDSSRILAYLERHFPEPPLLPDDPSDRDRALQLEDWLDESIGTATRIVYYQYRATDGRAIDPSPLSLAIIAIVRQQQGINAASAKLAAERLDLALPWIDDRWQCRGFLVGDRPSVADLTAAALLSPLALIPRYRDAYPALFDRIVEIHDRCNEPTPPDLGASVAGAKA